MPARIPSIPPPAWEALRRVWNADAFRPGQEEVVAAVLARRDVLAVLPTGGGKSLLYQLPALVQPGLAVVVSPLVALMDDQVAGLARRGVRAVALHAGRTPREVDQALTDAEFGKYRLVYLTPERLLSDAFRPRVERLPVSLLAVDEAHCVSEWGHDFRPAYRRISEIRPALSGPTGAPPVLAVTATATPEVRRDIAERLGLLDPAVVVRGFDRPNLVWSVHRVEDKRAKAIEIARAVPGTGIVYAGTRQGSEAWARALSRADVPCEAYHAGLGAATRSAVQRRWVEGETRYLAATSAFGMGVDKPDVRAVVHVALPPTLEAYYQEAGRGGRDGKRAFAALLVQAGDERLPRALAEEGHPDAETVQRVYAAAASLAGIAVGSVPDGPTTLDVEAVARLADTTPLTVRAATALIERMGVWTAAPARPDTVTLRLPDAAALRSWAERAAGGGRFARALLRLLPPDAHGAWADVPVTPLARRLGLPEERVRAGLAFLAERQLVDLGTPGDSARLVWSGARTERLSLDAAALAAARRRPLARLAHVLAYVNGVGCRRRHLLAYFGEPAAARCGRCDVCLGRHRPDVVTPDDEPLLRSILGHVERGEPRSGWLADANVPARRRDALADWLLSEGLVRLADPIEDRYVLAPKGLRALRTRSR